MCISTGRVKSRKRFTTRSNRSISLSSTRTAWNDTSLSAGRLSFRFSSHNRIEFSGFFTSWATPAVIRASEESLSESSSSLPMRSRDSRSRSVTSAPQSSGEVAPASGTACTVTPMRCGPPGATLSTNSKSAFSTGCRRSPENRSARRSGWPGGKISVAGRPRN